MAEYIALLHKDRDSDYGVSFPDFPGCVTAGKTLEEARRLAAEALAFHIEGMIEDGETLPSPSPLDIVMRERANRDAAAFIVTVPTKTERAVRVNVTLPASLVKRIDDATENRSRFLAQAADRMLRAPAGHSKRPTRDKPSKVSRPPRRQRARRAAI
jgi:predicted RNase H-like HicB family nuclease